MTMYEQVSAQNPQSKFKIFFLCKRIYFSINLAPHSEQTMFCVRPYIFVRMGEKKNEETLSFGFSHSLFFAYVLRQQISILLSHRGEFYEIQTIFTTKKMRKNEGFNNFLFFPQQNCI